MKKHILISEERLEELEFIEQEQVTKRENEMTKYFILFSFIAFVVLVLL